MPRSVKIFIDVTHVDCIRPDTFPRVSSFIKDLKEVPASIDFYFFADVAREISEVTVLQFMKQLLGNFQQLFDQNDVKINFNSVVATPFDLIIGRISAARLQDITATFEQDPVQATKQDYAFINRLSRASLTSFGNRIIPAQKNTLQFLLRELYRLPFAKDILPLGLLYAAMLFSDSNTSTLVISENLAVLAACLRAKSKLLQDQQITLQCFHLGCGVEQYGENDHLRIQANAGAALEDLIEKAVSTGEKSFYSIGGSRRDLIARFGLPTYSGSNDTESLASFEKDVERNRLVVQADDDATQWLAKMRKLATTANDYSQGAFTGSSDISAIWNHMVLNFVDPTYIALTLKSSTVFFSFLDKQKTPTGISIWKWHEDLWMIAIVRYRDDAKCFSDAEVKIIFNAPVKAMMDVLLRHQVPSYQVVTSHEMFLKNIACEVNSDPHMDLLTRRLIPTMESIDLFGLDRSVCDFLIPQNNGLGIIRIDSVGIYTNHFSHDLVIAIQSDQQQKTLQELIATVSIVDPVCHFQEQQLVMEVEQRILLFKFLLDIKGSVMMLALKPDLSGIAPNDATFLTESFRSLTNGQQIAVLKVSRMKIQTLIDTVGSHNIREKVSSDYKNCSATYFKLVHPLASSLGASMKGWLTGPRVNAGNTSLPPTPRISSADAENISLQAPQTAIESPPTNAATFSTTKE
jgi:hypothetical protein